MNRSDRRILTTHAGSLVRPPEIIEAMMRMDLGKEVDAKTYAEHLRQGVREVVREQAQLGLDVVDDGEFGKSNWVAYVTERMSGLELRTRGRSEVARRMVWPEQDRYGDFYRVYDGYEYALWLPDTPSKAEYVSRGAAFQIAVCVGPLQYRPQTLERDIANLKAALEGIDGVEGFIPVAAPASIEYMPNHHYATQEDYLFALADALSVEYRMIVDAGFILQIDDAILPMQYFMQFRDQGLAAYKKWAAVRIEALNRALRGIPEEKIRYHVCFGSQNVPHTTDPRLEDLIDLVLQVKAQAYSIEASNPRHEHEWLLWEDVRLPEGKILIPGVISHATNIVEHPELIAHRISNFARLLGRENLIAGTDCGFSQGWNAIRVHPQIQWAKLEALVAGGRLASKKLWH
jgi:5-methyltetrahydropteroyltriglutamate--homocysteine methyltransferase